MSDKPRVIDDDSQQHGLGVLNPIIKWVGCSLYKIHSRLKIKTAFFFFLGGKKSKKTQILADEKIRQKFGCFFFFQRLLLGKNPKINEENPTFTVF